MEKLHKEGKARAIGISHYCRRQLDDVLEIATVKPAVNQVEFHIGMGSAGVNATDDRAYLESKGVLSILLSSVWTMLYGRYDW